MSKYMYEHTKMPPYLPMPRFLLNCPISNTAKMLYIRLLGKAQLSQKNHWLDGQGRVYFIYPIHQMAIDMNKSATTIKDAMKELVKEQLLEKFRKDEDDLIGYIFYFRMRSRGRIPRSEIRLK